MGIFKKTEKTGSDIKVSLPASENTAVGKHGRGFVLIKQPWLTEKSGEMINSRKYIFIVDKKANKSEISKNIELIYNVKIASVNTVNIKGKTKRMKTAKGKTPGKKKAIITLKEGYKIETMSI